MLLILTLKYRMKTITKVGIGIQTIVSRRRWTPKENTKRPATSKRFRDSQ
jgi:hypothetical protein